MAGGRFIMSGVEYLLDRNEEESENCLHGGRGGLHSVEWRLHSDAYTPINDAKIPTGQIADVAGSRFDLRRPASIGSAVFDAHFVVAAEAGRLRPAVEIFSPDSGINLDISTT